MDIQILDFDFEPIDILDDYESLIWTDRYSECGDFEIYTDVTPEIVNRIKAGYFLNIKMSDRTMVVEDRRIITDEEDGDKLIITGRSLESILDRRIIWGHKQIDDTVQNGVELLLNENVISPTDTDRVIPNFTFETSSDTLVTTPTMNAQLEADNIYEYIVELCDVNSLGIKVLLVDGAMVCSLYAGEDRSYDQIENPHIVFSPEFDNLLSSEYEESIRKYKTIALVHGKDDIGLTEFTEFESVVSSGLNRREIFVKANDVADKVDGVPVQDAVYIEQLKQKGSEVLADLKRVEKFDAEVIYTKQNTFGVDFFMGDIVQIENEYGLKSKSRVTEFIISISKGGVEAYPTFTKIE